MLSFFKLIYKIGIKEVIYVVLYRLHKKLLTYLHKDTVTIKKHEVELLKEESNSCDLENMSFSFFSDYSIKFQKNIIWSLDPISKDELVAGAHWSCYDFSMVSDIKNVWEISRFNWWLRACVELEDLSCANQILNDWISMNPFPYSAQWTCAQECSIRLINFILGVEFSKQYHLLDEYRDFIKNSLQRIKLTHYYAIAQKNDHALAESCALLLAKIYLDLPYKRELKHLNKMIQKLFFEEGSFSMYSIFYHRYVADLLMYTYYLCSLKNISIYNKVTHKRLSDSLLFLSQLIFNHKGHTPNLGANDGANPFSIFSTDYRDFRESLSLMALILENRTLSDSPYSPLISKLLNISPKTYGSIVDMQVEEIYYEQFGIYIKRTNHYKFLMRTHSCENFRPSQEDISHIELWDHEKSILLDSGSYSYRQEMGDDLKRLVAHNSLSEKDTDTMRVQSKFLYKDWAKNGRLDIKNNKIDFYFSNYKATKMHRSVLFEEKSIIILDKIEGHKLQVTFNKALSSSNISLNSEVKPKKEKAFHSPNYHQLESHERLTYSCANQHRTVINLGA